MNVVLQVITLKNVELIFSSSFNSVLFHAKTECMCLKRIANVSIWSHCIYMELNRHDFLRCRKRQQKSKYFRINLFEMSLTLHCYRLLGCNFVCTMNFNRIAPLAFWKLNMLSSLYRVSHMNDEYRLLKVMCLKTLAQHRTHTFDRSFYLQVMTAIRRENFFGWYVKSEVVSFGWLLSLRWRRMQRKNCNRR